MKNTQYNLEEFSNKYNLDISNFREISFLGRQTVLAYVGDMDFTNQDFEEVPEEFLSISCVVGNLFFSGCKNLRSLDNLQNLMYVNILSLTNTKIENLKGLGNLFGFKTISIDTHLYTFDGINQNVHGFLSMKFDDNEEILSIEDRFYFRIYSSDVSFYGFLDKSLNEKFVYWKFLKYTDMYKDDILPMDVVDEFMKDCETYNLGKYYIKKSEKYGNLEYSSGLSLSGFNFTKVPKVFLYFSEFRSTLSFNDCVLLKDLRNLRNLKRVVGYLSLSNTEIENLKGLETLQNVMCLGLYGCKNFKTFDGLNPDVIVRGDELVSTFKKFVDDIKLNALFVLWKKINHKQENKVSCNNIDLFSIMLNFRDSNNLELDDSEIKEIVKSLECV